MEFYEQENLSDVEQISLVTLTADEPEISREPMDEPSDMQELSGDLDALLEETKQVQQNTEDISLSMKENPDMSLDEIEKQQKGIAENGQALKGIDKDREMLEKYLQEAERNPAQDTGEHSASSCREKMEGLNKSIGKTKNSIEKTMEQSVPMKEEAKTQSKIEKLSQSLEDTRKQKEEISKTEPGGEAFQQIAGDAADTRQDIADIRSDPELLPTSGSEQLKSLQKDASVESGSLKLSIDYADKFGEHPDKFEEQAFDAISNGQYLQMEGGSFSEVSEGLRDISTASMDLGERGDAGVLGIPSGEPERNGRSEIKNELGSLGQSLGEQQMDMASDIREHGTEGLSVQDQAEYLIYSADTQDQAANSWISGSQNPGMQQFFTPQSIGSFTNGMENTQKNIQQLQGSDGLSPDMNQRLDMTATHLEKDRSLYQNIQETMEQEGADSPAMEPLFSQLEDVRDDLRDMNIDEPRDGEDYNPDLAQEQGQEQEPLQGFEFGGEQEGPNFEFGGEEPSMNVPDLAADGPEPTFDGPDFGGEGASMDMDMDMEGGGFEFDGGELLKSGLQMAARAEMNAMGNAMSQGDDSTRAIKKYGGKTLNAAVKAGKGIYKLAKNLSEREQEAGGQEWDASQTQDDAWEPQVQPSEEDRIEEHGEAERQQGEAEEHEEPQTGEMQQEPEMGENEMTAEADMPFVQDAEEMANPFEFAENASLPDPVLDEPGVFFDFAEGADTLGLGGEEVGEGAEAGAEAMEETAQEAFEFVEEAGEELAAVL